LKYEDILQEDFDSEPVCNSNNNTELILKSTPENRNKREILCLSNVLSKNRNYKDRYVWFICEYNHIYLQGLGNKTLRCQVCNKSLIIRLVFEILMWKQHNNLLKLKKLTTEFPLYHDGGTFYYDIFFIYKGLKCAIEYDGDESHFNDETTKKNDFKKNKLSYVLDVNLLRIIPFDYTKDVGWDVADKVMEAVNWFFLYLDLKHEENTRNERKMSIYKYNPIQAGKFDLRSSISKRNLNNRILVPGSELFLPIKSFDSRLSFFLTQQVWNDKYIKGKIVSLQGNKIKLNLLPPKPVVTQIYTTNIEEVKKYFYKTNVQENELYNNHDENVLKKNLKYDKTEINFHIDVYNPLNMYIEVRQDDHDIRQVRQKHDIRHIYLENNERISISRNNISKNNHTVSLLF
jgi:hypothetical protein